jgi:hypothetical protein
LRLAFVEDIQYVTPSTARTTSARFDGSPSARATTAGTRADARWRPMGISIRGTRPPG